MCIIALFAIFYVACFILGNIAINKSFSKKAINALQAKFWSIKESPYLALQDHPWINEITPKLKEVFIETFDEKKVRGFLLKKNLSHRYLIYCHGYGGSHFEQSKTIHQLSDKFGINCLFIEQRAQFENNISLCTMGIREGRDVNSWIKYIIAFDPMSEIILYGESMGGASICFALRDKLPQNVKGFIVDSSYTSVYEQTKFSSRKAGRFVSSLLTYSIYLAFKYFHHINIKKYTAKEALKENKLPCLIIHGGQDQSVDFKNLDINYQLLSNNSRVQKEIFLNSNHCLCAYDEFDRYVSTLERFIGSIWN